jgi:hypothetical protein
MVSRHEKFTASIALDISWTTLIVKEIYLALKRHAMMGLAHNGFCGIGVRVQRTAMAEFRTRFTRVSTRTVQSKWLIPKLFAARTMVLPKELATFKHAHTTTGMSNGVRTALRLVVAVNRQEILNALIARRTSLSMTNSVQTNDLKPVDPAIPTPVLCTPMFTLNGVLAPRFVVGVMSPVPFGVWTRQILPNERLFL